MSYPLPHPPDSFRLHLSLSFFVSSQLVLFPPSDLPYLYYVGRPKGTLDYKYPGTFTRNISSITRHSVVFGSSVNVDKPNLLAHPLYAKVSNLEGHFYGRDPLLIIEEGISVESDPCDPFFHSHSYIYTCYVRTCSHLFLSTFLSTHSNALMLSHFLTTPISHHIISIISRHLPRSIE